MTSPARLQLSRRKGFRLPDSCVNCARPGPHGNPFVIGKDRITSRNEAVAMFTLLMDGYLAMTCGPEPMVQKKTAARIKAALPGLRGHDLACWCRLPAPGEPDICHAAVLLAIANNDTPKTRFESLKPILDAIYPQGHPTLVTGGRGSMPLPRAGE